MLWSRDEAEDATQDILVKMLRNLTSFEGRSRLRTWLYRIALNHLLNRKKGPVEAQMTSFEDYGAGLDSAPDEELAGYSHVERDVLIEEAKVGCMTGMLLCLNRDQRIAYVLGSVFALEDVVCAELLDISREAFRKRLSRARHDLHSFMQGKCGLVNTDNPCRCARKTKAFIDRGYVNPDKLAFMEPHARKVKEVATRDAATVFLRVTDDYPRLYREHPFADPPAILGAVKQALIGTALEGALDG